MDKYNFQQEFPSMPLVAILRGVTPEEVAALGQSLYRAGVRVIEVPLNSPEPLVSIQYLVDALGEACLCGAGTVLTPSQVDAVFEVGGRLIVTPNTDTSVINRAVERGMVVIPGVGTATEAFQAYSSGARYLKLFPASTYGDNHIRALKAVLPKETKMLAVGGVGVDNIEVWSKAGIDGVGIASEIYTPGDSPDIVYSKALAIVSAVKASLVKSL